MKLIRRQNSAMVETSILLTIFIVLVFYLIFFGITFINRLSLQEGVNYAAAGGEQELSEITVVDNIGSADILDTAVDTSMSTLYDGQNVQDVLTEVTYDPIGYYEIVDGEVVYTVDEDRLSPTGQYIINDQLDQYVGTVAGLLNPNIEETSASLEYEYTYADIEDDNTGTVHTQRDQKSFNMIYTHYQQVDDNTTLYRDDTNDFRKEPKEWFDTTTFAGFLLYDTNSYWQSQY